MINNYLNKHRSLRSRIILGLISYLIILTLGILTNDFVVNEHAEELVWQASLNNEMDRLISHHDKDSHYEWPNTASIAMFSLNPKDDRHKPLIGLIPGIHDEFIFEGKMWVILIRKAQAQTFALLLNIDDLEKTENEVENRVFLAAGIVSLALCILIAWAVSWLVRPLRDLAQQIQQLAPDKKHQHIFLPKNSSSELEVIAEAMNTYIKRNESFIERERDFINMASHELRTPLSIIDGVVKVSLEDNTISNNTRNRLFRIHDAISNVNEMVTLLLVLAKDPARLQEGNELVFLDQVLEEIKDEYANLAENKNVNIILNKAPKIEVFAPLQMMKCALGNLLRNAIEHSYGGDITITMDPDSTVTIRNRNNHVTMKEISELYGRLARKSKRNGGGLGLELISRLCAHCNWKLSFSFDPSTVTFSIKFS